MAGVIDWFDAQTNGLPVELWNFHPQQSTFEPFKPYLDPQRKDEPIRITDSSYLQKHSDEVAARPSDSELIPAKQIKDKRGKNGKPWETQTARRDLARTRKIRGRVPPGKSIDEANRSPAPYGKEPIKSHADEAEALLDEMCVKHRVNLQLLFDTYGVRDYTNRNSGANEGVILGGELHRLVWDAGFLASHGHNGVHADVNEYFKECVGSAYRELLKVSFNRFKVMLIRTAELMSKTRNRVQPNEHIVDSMRDLVRDYLSPLCHAHFWQEASV
jgi:hypothetical protein